jgi:teichuronic acid biosynthesis glycosyltransferase TuaG
LNHRVSIITPSYGSEKFIEQTIESIQAQTYLNWEMIIVDDMSPDNSNEIIERYIEKDSRIKLVRLEKNGGAAVARNRAIEEASGRFIAFLDADDLWKPSKLEKQIDFMIQKGCELSYSYYDVVDEDNNKLEKVFEPPLKLNYSNLLKANYIGCLSAIYDTQKMGKIYMPLIKKRQDYGLWLRILKQTDYAYCIPDILATYRVRNESLSSNKLQLLSYNYRLFREHEQFSSLKSFYYLCWNILIKVLKS